jgi:hypothetical protein
MQLPRFAGTCHFTMPVVLLLALLAPSLVCAESRPTKASSAEPCVSEEDEGPALTDEQRLRALAILFTTMTWSGEYPPPNFHPPYVVKPPHRTGHWKQPHHGTVGGSPIPSSTSPEPASLGTGLLGSGMACLFAWLRKRRRARRLALDS